MRRLVAAGLSALAMLLVAASSARASAITVSGTTAGCFGTSGSCTSLGDQPAQSVFDFAGTGFLVTTTAAGDATNIALGTLHRADTSAGNFTGTVPFVLQLLFTSPIGVAGEPNFYTAQISGQFQGGGADSWLHFDNTVRHVSFANDLVSGSFDFLIHDIGIGIGDSGGLNLGKGETRTLFGAISNATMDVAPTAVTPVPEPASLLLLGGGLMVVAARMRRKKA